MDYIHKYQVLLVRLSQAGYGFTTTEQLSTSAVCDRPLTFVSLVVLPLNSEATKQP